MYAKGSMIVYEINNKVTTNFNIKMILNSIKFSNKYSINLSNSKTCDIP